MRFGKIDIEFLGHSGFMISGKRKVVIDPYHVSDKVGKADIVLITHSHYDHCSSRDIEKVCRAGTVVICPADCQSAVARVKGVDMQVIEVGDEIEVLGVKVQVVPAYNLRKKFHPKEEGWVGYVVKMSGAIIYHAGDSDLIPEMQRLSGYGKRGNNFIALLPVSGKYVMTSEEAVSGAVLINPDLAIPMHYGAGVGGTKKDAEEFVKLCKERGIRAEILERVNN